MQKRLIIYLLVFLMGCFIACQEGEDNSGRNYSTTPTPTWGDLVVDVATKTSDPLLGLIDDAANAFDSAFFYRFPENEEDYELDDEEADGLIQFEAALVVIRDIRFHLASGNYSTPRFEGPFVVNLIEDGAVKDEVFPEIGAIEAVPDEYGWAQFRFTGLEEEDIPTEMAGDSIMDILLGNSVVIRGTFRESEENDINGDGEISDIPFQFISDIGETVEITTTSPFAVLESITNYIFLTFHIDEWFGEDGETLQWIEPEDYELTDGYLLVWDEGSDSISDIVEDIEENIEDSFGFAWSEDDEFDFDEYDEWSSSGRDGDGFDDECFDEDEEDWDNGCLGVRLECEDDCYEEDCFDDDNLDWLEECLEEQDECVDDCWE